MGHPLFAADQVLGDLGINSYQDLRFLQEIAWERKVLVREVLIEGAEARLTILGRRAIISVSTLTTDAHRKRFAIAHELGHWELHRYQSSLSVCIENDIGERYQQASNTKLEQEANEFASALLMPERFFLPLCKRNEPSFEHFVELAEKFDVSMTAATLRYTRYCEEPIAIVFSQENRIKWYQSSKSFDELRLRVDVRSILDPASRAGAFFQGNKLLPNMRSVKASAWFTSENCRSDASIQEQSKMMPTYNAVLTLLWVDDEIDDDDDY